MAGVAVARAKAQRPGTRAQRRGCTRPHETSECRAAAPRTGAGVPPLEPHPGAPCPFVSLSNLSLAHHRRPLATGISCATRFADCRASQGMRPGCYELLYRQIVQLLVLRRLWSFVPTHAAFLSYTSRIPYLCGYLLTLQHPTVLASCSRASSHFLVKRAQYSDIPVLASPRKRYS